MESVDAAEFREERDADEELMTAGDWEEEI